MKFRIFLILPDPGCPGDPKVGPNRDCVASWDTVASKHLVGRMDPRRRVLGSQKMVPWRFWQFCKANVAGKL